MHANSEEVAGPPGRGRRWSAIPLLALLVACAPPPDPAPRNLLVVVVDTLRADALGFLGNARGTSPELDAFAAGSTVFERAWAQGTYTPASFLSYMSSTYVRTHGWDFHVAEYPEAGVCGWDELEMLPEVLSRRGFHTAALVANFRLHPKGGFARGFQVWNRRGTDELLQDEDHYQADKFFFGDEQVVQRAGEIMADWQRGERHFLYVHLMAPHLPLVPSPESLRELGLPIRWAPGDETQVTVKRMQELKDSPDAEVRRRVHDGYLASVRDADRSVGEILRMLDAAGHRDDTIVAFLSDHGEEIWEHGDYGHFDGVWEPLAHVPLVVRAPGRAPERVADRAVGLIDLAPTLLDLLGLERPASWQGGNLFAPAPGRPVVTERFREVAVTVDGRSKAVRRGAGFSHIRWRHYDLAEDPGESHPEEGAGPGNRLQPLYSEWAKATPKTRRDREEEPVGPCRTMTDLDREGHEEALRALGYLE